MCVPFGWIRKGQMFMMFVRKHFLNGLGIWGPQKKITTDDVLVILEQFVCEKNNSWGFLGGCFLMVQWFKDLFFVPS